MAKRTVEQVKAYVAEEMDKEISAEDIKEKSELIKVNLTREQVAFVIASTEDDVSDEDWKTLLMEMYTGNEQSVVDAAWNMTGFDGTDEQKESMTPYIEAFMAAHDGRHPNLSPNALWAVLTDADNQKSCDTTDEWNDAIEQAEPEDEEEKPTPEQEKAAEAAKASAVAIGDKLAKDTELQGILGKGADSSQYIKVAPVLAMFRLEKNFTADEILGWPEVGSKHPKYVQQEGNVLYDKYKVGKGKKKSKLMSFYGTILDRMPEGILINNDLEELAKENKGKYATSPTTGWTLAKRNSEKAVLLQRYKDQTKYFGNAVTLFKQVAWLKTYPNLHLSYDTDEHGNLRRTTTPFIMAPKKGEVVQGEFGDAYTIADILRLNKELAILGGSTWDSLNATLKREKSEEEKAKDKQEALVEAKKLIQENGGVVTKVGEPVPTAQAIEVGLIKSMKQANSYLAMVAHFGMDLVKAEPDAAISREFNKELGNNDELVLSLHAIKDWFDSFKGRLEVRVNDINKKIAAAKQEKVA